MNYDGSMRHALFVLVVSSLAACAGALTFAEGKRDYLNPALCAKQEVCAPDLFKNTYPGGLDDCVKKRNDTLKAEDERESVCSSSEWRTCANDIRLGACPADPAAGGIPTVASTCNKCG